MALHWLFPTPVLQVDLEPDSATAAAMQQQLEHFDAQVYQHPEFSDRNHLTGDLLGHRRDQGYADDRPGRQHNARHKRKICHPISPRRPHQNWPGPSGT